jgi:hypothetical protein
LAEACPQRRWHLGADDISTHVDVDLEATSIDADEYLAGLHDGPRGDDNEDLGAADLFDARARDADDDGDRMATLIPSSNASSMAAGTVTPRVSNLHDYVNHMFKRP